MKKLLAFVLAAILLTSVLSSCTSLESTKEEAATALRISGFDVPYEMLRYTAMNALADRRKSDFPDGISTETDEGKELNREILDEAVDALCVTYGCFALARDRGIDPFGEAIGALADSTLKSKAAAYSSDSEFKEALAASGMNRSVLRVLILYETVYAEVFEDMIKKGDVVTDKDELRSIFESDEFASVKVLYFSTERHSIDECRALAENAASALAAGADFDEYVNEHGEMLEMFKNTDGLYVCHGIWKEELENAAFALAIGEISPPIETEDGVRILMRCGKTEKYIDENFDSLRETYEEGVFGSAMENAVKAASEKVELPDDFYDRSVFDMKMN